MFPADLAEKADRLIDRGHLIRPGTAEDLDQEVLWPCMHGERGSANLYIQRSAGEPLQNSRPAMAKKT